MVRILGLDPGSRITGYGVVDAGVQGVRYVASGCIRVGQGEMAGRLLSIQRHVAELVTSYRPAEVAVERVFMARNPDSALKLGQARGAALCGACGDGAPAFEYAPRAVKQAVTGTGSAEKSQVMLMVKSLLALEGRLSADAADALAIAFCHAQHRGAALRLRAGSNR